MAIIIVIKHPGFRLLELLELGAYVFPRFDSNSCWFKVTESCVSLELSEERSPNSDTNAFAILRAYSV